MKKTSPQPPHGGKAYFHALAYECRAHRSLWLGASAVAMVSAAVYPFFSDGPCFVNAVRSFASALLCIGVALFAGCWFVWLGAAEGANRLRENERRTFRVQAAKAAAVSSLPGIVLTVGALFSLLLASMAL